MRPDCHTRVPFDTLPIVSPPSSLSPDGQPEPGSPTPAVVGLTPNDRRVVFANPKFSSLVAAFSSVRGVHFVDVLIETKDQNRVAAAFDSVMHNGADEEATTLTLRGVATLSQGRFDQAPSYIRVDWTISYCSSFIILSGHRVAPTEVCKYVFSDDSVDTLMSPLKAAPIACHALDEGGHIVWVNDMVLHMLGYTADELLGQHLINLCPDETWESVRQVACGDVKEAPIRIRTKSEGSRPFLVDSLKTIDPHGSFRGTTCFVRDDVVQSRDSLLSNTSSVDSDNLVKKIFHEIRTPCHLQVPLSLSGSGSAVGRHFWRLTRCLTSMHRSFSDLLQVHRLRP